MSKSFIILLVTLTASYHASSQGNYVFSGGEAANFGDISLPTPSGKTWGTDRLAVPGYFSAVGTAVYSAAADGANVNGYVKHYASAANQSFVFPVGSGTDLRSLTVSGTIAANAQFATAWILGNPSNNLDPTAPNAGAHAVGSVGSGITSVSPVGQWDWQDLSATGSGVTVTVSIPDVSNFALVTNLRLVGWNGTQWVSLGGATATGNTENSSLSGTMISGITAIGIGSNAPPLPVTLAAFQVAKEAETALLQWATTAEINSDRFDIQHSIDLKSWAILGSVAAHQDSKVRNEYAFVHQKPAQGNNYYRLKMIDLDGTFSYSRIRSLEFGDQIGVVVFPNPASDQITINLADWSSVSQIKLFNALGTQVYATAVAGKPANQVDVKSMSPGVYAVQVLRKDGTVSMHRIVLK